MPTRNSDYSIDPVFLDRWSPRAFDGSTMLEEDLLTMLEAARWAPSSFNYQPWRFAYALRGDPHWDAFLSALLPFNAAWAGNASALLFVVSDQLMRSEEKNSPSHTHSFDAGAAWANLALQARMSGYYTHGMAGIDFDAAARILNLPADYRIEAAIAVGRIGDPSVLPERLREREAPSDRKDLREIAIAGPFTATGAGVGPLG